eukprot:CAMPEP_0116092036 /NCGR_PEP_ID=MMETSP0327-20121206/7822_1 /TAXON_ID=44447 /ORGANISM="Pseudo-nitzschia delicatissima, Strain B596" /LENGTH=171 /DNA_ID=CAMNT_0003583423 /DNA_START=41 /DNA_END=556 /DNA_ORIENTATION=+
MIRQTPVYLYDAKNPPYGEFSNLYPCEFQVSAAELFLKEKNIDPELRNKSITVNSAEQAITWMKAILMNDSKSALLIEQAKAKEVTPVDEQKWKQWRERITIYVLTQKFSSSKDLYKVLEQTMGRDIVEAGPRESIWGVGIDVSEVQSENLFGRALVIVRESLAEQHFLLR